MDAPNATVSNSALWAEYLHKQWGFWLEPAGSRAITAAIGASIASAYAFWLEAFVGRLYEDNAPAVTNFVHRVEEVKREAELRGLAPSGASFESVPQWLAATQDAPIEDSQAVPLHV